MMIDMTKKYRTRDGRKVRVLCTDANGPYPVLALVEGHHGEILSLNAEGFHLDADTHHKDDLIETGLYGHIKIDQPVWVQNGCTGWLPRHFAGVAEDGRPRTWIDGYTSHTKNETSTWDKLSEVKP